MTDYSKLTPSARKGIHSNCQNCPLEAKLPSVMGHYGMVKNRNSKERNIIKTAVSKEDEGIDEVDNVMSKLNQEVLIRRNSVDNSNSDINLSDDEDESDEAYSSESLDFTSPEDTIWYQKFCGPYIPVAAFICLIALLYHNFSNESGVKGDIYDETKFYKDVTYLGEKYKVTDTSILQIQSGISTIFQREDTGSFIFTYNSHNSNFNPTQFNNFVNDVASSAARFLRNESNIQNYLTLDSSKLEVRVPSELIEKYREDVTKTGLMLVKDLDEVPSTLAMAFHYYCDEFNPLIKKSAIFFTLNMARCSDHKTSHANIEKCLTNKWPIIPEDNMVPLLNRVVNIVVDVTSVF